MKPLPSALSLLLLSVFLTACGDGKTAALSGTVSYKERIALPPEAVIEIVLLDTSRMDASSARIARQTVTTGGGQPPFAYELRYDPADIEEGGSYAVAARALIDDEVRFVSQTHAAALNEPEAGRTIIDIVLRPVPATVPGAGDMP